MSIKDVTTSMKTVTEGDCSPINGVSFICGVTNVEDLILVPNTKWVIGSGFTDQVTTQNYLHLFDSETETGAAVRSEEHTSELQSRFDLVCRLLLEKKKV